jgi:hypothetical protein
MAEQGWESISAKVAFQLSPDDGVSQPEVVLTLYTVTYLYDCQC